MIRSPHTKRVPRAGKAAAAVRWRGGDHKETWQIIDVVLAAVAVGFLVPALVQMRRTLRSAEIFL